MEVIESVVSCHMLGHSILSPLFTVVSCVSELYQGFRSIGKFGDRIDLITYRFQWIWVVAVYQKETLVLLAREDEAVE